MKSNPHIKYFKRTVDSEDILPRPVEWGRSAIYFETSEEGFPIRQIQVFESGVVLAYGKPHYHDKFGWLHGEPIYTDPKTTVAITSKEFHQAWMRHHDALNRTPSESA